VLLRPGKGCGTCWNALDLRCWPRPQSRWTWRAALAVGADPAVIASMSLEAFTAALRGQVRAAGGQRVCHRVARAIHAAAAEPGGIAAERCAALERAGFADGDWMSAAVWRVHRQHLLALDG
jgi:hypothetical protein